MKKFLIFWEKDIGRWTGTHYLRLAIFNMIVMLMVLLRSAGYFDPYWPITINMVIFISLILSILLLETRSRVLFVVAIVFWVFAGFLRIIGVDVWAERTSIYVYQAIFLGTILLLAELSGIIKIDNGETKNFK